MKKIAILFDQIPNNGGGIVTTYKNLIDILPEYKISFISVFEAKDTPFNKAVIYEILNGINIDLISLQLPNLFRLKDWKNWGEFIKTAFYYLFSIIVARKRMGKLLNQFDYIIASSPSASIFLPKNINFILDIQSSYNYFFNGSIFTRMQLFLARKPKCILFRTMSDCNCYRKKYAKLNIKSDYVYNTVLNDCQKVQISPIKNKICFVGRLSAEKNLEYLVELGEELIKTSPEVVIDIYGEGPQMLTIRDLIKSKKLHKNIFLKGYANSKNIYAEYSMLWVTSSYEGFCLVILEAKRCGTPVVTTNWGDGVSEVVWNQKDGFICSNKRDFLEKTRYLLNPSNQEIFRKNAYNNSEFFSVSKVHDKWIEIINNING